MLFRSEILNFAVNSGLIESNTCLKISSTFKSVRQRNNPRVSIEEIPTLIKSIHSAKIEKKTQLLILFQLLTMVRPNEASNASWSEFDFDKKEWNIPAERMKVRFLMNWSSFFIIWKIQRIRLRQKQVVNVFSEFMNG